jgi:hypothetical protein
MPRGSRVVPSEGAYIHPPGLATDDCREPAVRGRWTASLW